MKNLLKNYFGFIIFYLVLIGGIALIDIRFNNTDQIKNNDIVAYNK